MEAAESDAALAGISTLHRTSLENRLNDLAARDPLSFLRWLDSQKSSPDAAAVEQLLASADAHGVTVAELCRSCTPEMAGVLASAAVLRTYKGGGIQKALDAHAGLKPFAAATPVLEELFKAAVEANDHIFGTLMQRFTGTSADQNIMMLYLNALSEHDAGAAVKCANSVPWDSPAMDNWRFKLVFKLFTEHPENYPLATVAAALPRTGDYPQRLLSLASAAAAKDAAAALQWAQDLPVTSDRAAVLSAILPGITDPKAFSQALSSLMSFSDQQQVVKDWAGGLVANKQPAEAINAALQVTEPTLRHTAVADVLQRLSQRDPAAAVNETVRLIEAGMPAAKLWDMLSVPGGKTPDLWSNPASQAWFNSLEPAAQKIVVEESRHRTAQP